MNEYPLDSRYEKKYLPADETVLVNDNDVDLRPIRLRLPKPPDIRLIDGYGLKPEDQRFEKIEIPRKLAQIEEDAKEMEREKASRIANYTITRFRLQKRYWSLFLERKEDLRDEIKWIKKIWWHRINGYWFFNMGKPTYISGWHFDYLNFWYIAEVTPDGNLHFRDRDRKEFLCHKYAHETTETFANTDKNGWAIPEADGRYRMRDLGRRLCYGPVQPKNRRSGNTNKGLSIIHSIVTITIGTDGAGVMSYTGDNAEVHFTGKMLEAMNRMPLFIRPFSTSGFTSPKSITHKVPANEFDMFGLNNEITYSMTSSSTFYDGKKLVAALIDESGKTQALSVDERWMVIKNCLSQGDGAIIHGYCYQPSTAEEYTAGGAAYRAMANKSSFYQRKPNGQTQSGLFRLYVKSDEGLDLFIDSHGYSVKDKILPHQRREGFKQTATSYINDDFEFLLKQDTPESLSEYRKKKKMFPMSWKDVWVGESGEIGFPTEMIVETINELRKKSETVPGNFEWTDGFGSNVEWQGDKDGRWEVSEFFEGISNRRVMELVWDTIDMEEKRTWMPTNPSKGTVGADPFNFKLAQEVKKDAGYSKSGMSDGGISVYWEHDSKIDKAEVLRSERKSDNVICTYRYRAKTDDDYCEDVLKTCIWYGYMVYPEMNLPIVYKNFRLWGYLGYLKYDVDYEGRMKNEPGVRIHGNNKQEGFNLLRTFFQYRCKHIKHLRLLEEARDITTMDELRNYDTLASLMVALMGSQSKYSKLMETSDDDTIDLAKITDILRQYPY